MLSVKSPSCFNDRWGGMIRSVRPLLAIERFTRYSSKCYVDCMAKTSGVHQHRAIHLVLVGFEVNRHRFRGPSADENWKNGNRMASFVKILQTQSIIPYWTHCCALKRALAPFELDHKPHWAKQ